MPTIQVQELAKKFQDLRQTTEIVAEITTIFRERALLISQYTTKEEIKNTRYHDMLRDEIREFVSMSSCRTLEDMIAIAQEWEIELKLQTKHTLEQVRTVVGSVKRPNTFDSRSRGQKGQGRCAKCGRSHKGSCCQKGECCFN